MSKFSMSQMYKVFYNERTVFFIENDKIINEEADYTIHYFKNKKHLKSAIKTFIETPESKKLFVVHKDVESTFKKFSKLHKVIEAAGGLVKNKNSEVLFIFRRNKWDLPKGKIEKKETSEIGAIREVEEECGIHNLVINKLLKITYHTYNLNNKDILKRTFWYEMAYTGNENLTPQFEEDITEAKWLKKSDLPEVIKNTFPSIIEVMGKARVI